MPSATSATWLKTLGRLPWWRTRVYATTTSGNGRVKELSKGPHSFTTTQLDLPNDLQARLRAWVQANVAREDLSPDEAQDDAFHVTVLYGLKTDRHEVIRQFVEGTGPVRIELGALAQFDKHPDYDVLIVPIVRETGLRVLRTRLTDQLPWEATQDGYAPHVTLAYVRKGAGRRHLGATAFLGERATVDRLRVSDSQGVTSWVSLLPVTKLKKTNGNSRTYAASIDPLKEGEVLTFNPETGERGVWRNIGGRSVFIAVRKGESVPKAVRRAQAGDQSAAGGTRPPTLPIIDRSGEVASGEALQRKFGSYSEAKFRRLFAKMEASHADFYRALAGEASHFPGTLEAKTPQALAKQWALFASTKFKSGADAARFMATARAQANEAIALTQWRLSEGGRKADVTLYRGFTRGQGKAGSPSKHLVSFWSDKREIAAKFADKGGFVVEATVPIRHVIASWQTSGGRLDEDMAEYLVDRGFVFGKANSRRVSASVFSLGDRGPSWGLGGRTAELPLSLDPSAVPMTLGAFIGLLQAGLPADAAMMTALGVSNVAVSSNDRSSEKALALVMTPHGYLLPLSREPTRIERKVDFATIVLEGDRLQAQSVARVMAVLANARDKLLALVSRKHQAGELTTKFVLDLELRGLGQLVPTLREALGAFFRFGQRTADGELQRGRAGVRLFAKDDLVEGPSGQLGVWRTIRGRRVFIEEGQSLEEALSDSSARGSDGGDAASKTVALWKAERRVGDIKGGPRLGEFFSDNEVTANNLSGGSGRVERREIRLEKPLTIPANTGLDFEFYDTDELNTLLKSARVEYRFSDGEDQEVWRHVDDGGLRLVRALKKAGYDSIQFPEFLGGKEQITTLIFDPANKTFVLLKALIAAHPDWDRARLKAALTGNGKDYQVKLVPEGLPPEAALEFFERKAALWATDVRGPLLQSAKAVLFDAIKRGAPLRETIAMLEQVFLPWVGDEDALRGDGDVTAPFRLETLVRTNTGESFNEGRKAQFQEEVDSGFIIGFQYSAIIDTRTCFRGDTPVATGLGWRPIADLRLGDTVISGAGKSCRVLGLKRQRSSRLVRVRWRDGRVVVCTATHPFWVLTVKGSGWKEAEQLAGGDACGTREMLEVSRCIQSLGRSVRTNGSKDMSALPWKIATGRHSPPSCCGSDISNAVGGSYHKTERAVVTKQTPDDHAGSRSGCCGMASRPSRPESAQAFAFGIPEGMGSSVLCGSAREEIWCDQGSNLWLEETLRSAKVRTSQVLGETPSVASEPEDDDPVEGSERTRPTTRCGNSRMASAWYDILRGSSMAVKEAGGRVRRTILASRNERSRSEEGFYGQTNGVAVCSRSGKQGYSEGAIPERTVRFSADCSVVPVATGWTEVAAVEYMLGTEVVYDIEVEHDHTYLVAGGLIVHNTEVCRFLDEKVFRPDSPELDRLTPPRHYSCRSLLSPVLRTEGPVEYITPRQVARGIDLSGAGFVERRPSREVVVEKEMAYAEA